MCHVHLLGCVMAAWPAVSSRTCIRTISSPPEWRRLPCPQVHAFGSEHQCSTVPLPHGVIIHAELSASDRHELDRTALSARRFQRRGQVSSEPGIFRGWGSPGAASERTPVNSLSRSIYDLCSVLPFCRAPEHARPTYRQRRPP